MFIKKFNRLTEDEFVLLKGTDKMVEMMNFLFNNPKEKRPRYTLSKVESVTYKEMGIV